MLLSLALALAVGCGDEDLSSETDSSSPPGAPQVSITPQEPRTSDNLAGEIAERLPGLRYTFAWSLDGEIIQDLTSDLVPRARTSKGQIWEITVTPVDGQVEGTPGSDSVTILNTPPRITSAQFELEVPSPGTGLDVMFTTEDIDEDEVTIHWEWSVDGESTSFDGPSVPGSALARGQVWTVTLTPDDGEELGESRTLTTEVGNTPPVLGEVVVGPEPAFTDTVLVAEALDVFDPDGDELTTTYRFYVNGRLSQSGIESTLDGEHFVKGNEIYVQAYVEDDLDRSETVRSNDLVIQNTAPVTTAVTLAPFEAVTTTDLLATVTGTDLDGDVLTPRYIWLLNDTIVEDVTTATFPSSRTTKGDRVAVRGYLVDDEDAESDPMTSAEVHIENTPPGPPRGEVTPRAPIQSLDDLICSIAEESVDDDGDPVTYSMSWTVDGVPFEDTFTTVWPNDSVPGEFTLAEELWICTITPNDGTVDGEPATARRRITFDGTIIWDGEVTFDTCGAIGRLGPTQSQCDARYLDTFLEDSVELDGGIQRWVVPAPGDYRIVAHGAQGASADPGYVGGRGARIEGSFFLDEGDVLFIAVGQEGTENGCNGGGGGGTWVMTSSDEPLLVAGGGAGTRTSVSQDGCPGRDTQFGGTGSSSGTTWGCGAKSTDLRQGGRVSSGSWGSGGGGLESNGAGDGGEARGGRSYLSGLAGGEGADPGGFGAGGAGNGSCGGGGGGGYSGGDGGRVAGGGGSFNGGFGQVNETGGADPGHGRVIIDLL